MKPATIQKRFGSVVREYRLNSRLTGPALAKKSGISKGLLSTIEHGNSNVSLVTIHKLARGLRVGVNELVS